MRKTKQIILHDEACLNLKIFLPLIWGFEENVEKYRENSFKPDFDFNITDQKGNISNKEFRVYVKGISRKCNKDIMQIKTPHLEFYKANYVPIALIQWVKSTNEFYYAFAQVYINEILSRENPEWRSQNKNTIRLSKLESPAQLEVLAEQGFDYIAKKRVESLGLMK